jgi:hypothetical protein
MKRINIEADDFRKDSKGNYRRETQTLHYELERKNVNGKYRIRLYQRISKKERKLVESSRGSTFKKTVKKLRAGVIVPYFQKDRVSTEHKVYENFSTRPPRSTAMKNKKKSGERYKIQFVGYFEATKRGKGSRTSIIVVGISDGYDPKVRRPSRQELARQAMDNAKRQAAYQLYGDSGEEVEITLVRGGYRYYSHR